MLAVPTITAGNAQTGSTHTAAASSPCDTALAARASRSSAFSPSRLASVPPLMEPTMASATCGRKMAPYCALDRPSVPVRTVLLAGKLTIARPCRSAAP